MTHDNAGDWWAEAPDADTAEPDIGASVRDARVALQAAGTALALWRTHRRGCACCNALRPPAGPGQACYRGRPLLVRLLRAQDAAAGAERTLAAVKIARPGRLF